MIIRQASETDANNISQMLCKMSKKYICSECTVEGAMSLLKSMNTASIVSYIASGYRYYLAELGDNIVGIIGIKQNNHLFHLFVDDSMHHQGIALKLWNKVLNSNQQAQDSKILTVNSSTYALGFYEKLGFKVESKVVISNGIPSIPMKFKF